MQNIPMSGRVPEMDLAIGASVRAGDSVMEVYGGEFEARTKGDGSPVTQADLKSNEIIKEMLSGSLHAILSEEDGHGKASRDESVWIVDPLDGTSDFIDRNGEFTVMIALVRGGRPIVGVINCPALGVVFAAQRGRGAFRHSGGQWERIAVTNTPELDRCRMVHSRHHFTDGEAELARRLGIAELASVGSSLKAARVSCGEAEVYLTTSSKMHEWDSAASYCIVTEAGGMMTDMLGRDISYNSGDLLHRNGLLVTNGNVHDKIVREFRRSGPSC